MDIQELEQIISILKKNDVTEFELKEGSTEIKLSRTPQGQFVATGSASALPMVMPALAPHSGAGSAAHAGLPVAAPIAPQAEEGLVKVESPIVGTFYRKPSPDADPFCKEGDRVKAGQTLCIIEAMKLMNEIESPSAGTLVKIFLTDGQVVEYGEVLFLIRPD